MTQKLTSIFYFIILFLCSLFSGLISQTRIDFSQNEKFLSLDYSSFYPHLMLKHKIGDFYKLPKNPVLSPARSGWDQQDVADPFILVTADSIFLFYDGSNKGHYSIGYAVRDDAGWAWVNRKQILKPDNQSWRSFHLIAPTFIPGNTDHFIYNGNSSDSELGYQIGMSRKDKSEKWLFSSTKPLFKTDTGNWDFAGNAYQDIVYFPNEKKYRMWFSGFSGPFASIGIAESDDGKFWQKSNKPVLESSPGVVAPEVVFNGEKYIMYFAHLDLSSGFGTKIKSAESDDGINWDNIRIVLKPEAKWEGKRLMRPNISFFEEQVHLFYCAQKGSKWHIGEAIADAFFESSGIWQSKEIKNDFQRLIIKYELPFQTEIKMELIDGKQGSKKLLDLESEKKELRTGVYQSSFILEKKTGSFKLKIQLATKNELRSPVIYQIDFEK
ncbi:MAG: hypothetical protein D8M58_07995 [Calditrichaeota bacterium]|nr:MAG: hypothetical protein DWQ03_18495 [Calditrichota bacterium]MBL1205323.1 hypothetical protein [Calditrichota bacterium]NOG45152.1 hypothetical protein [Calditrichota bacterium]